MKIESNETNDGSEITNLKPDIAYFYGLDSENRICFDCGGAFPCCVSINNGVFLCKFCGENHRKKLNYNISFIRDINDEWDQYLLSYATRGGNSRFKRLCLQYEVPCQSLTENDDEKINKYLIRLGEYVRLLLKSEINCDEPPQPLYNEVAKNPINKDVIYFPEFENYKLFSGKNLVNEKNQNMATNGGESTGAKIWEGTKTTFNIMKTTSGIIYNTGKPIVSFLGNAAFSGLKYVGTSVWNYYMNNNETTNGEGNNLKINQTNEGNNNITITQEYNPNYNNSLNNNNYNYNNNNNIYNNNNYNNKNNNNNLNNNYNYNYMNQYNNHNLQNKNYLTNSNKFNIFTINDINSNNKINMNNKNNMNNMIPKPMKNSEKMNNNNNIPNYYDINSINNESVNNITFYLNNNNNSLDMSSKTNNDFLKKGSLLNHENIIVNKKYINEKNVQIYNDKKEKNNMNNKNSTEKNISLMNTPGISNNLSMNNNPNNAYPNYSSIFGNNENNNTNNEILMNREIIDKNVPNIIGEEINQEKAKYPIFQSVNLLENDSFLPVEDGVENESTKKEDN